MNYAAKYESANLPFASHELSEKTPSNTHVACTLIATPLGRNLIKLVAGRIGHLHKVYSVLDPQDTGPEWEPYEIALQESLYDLNEFDRFLSSCGLLWARIHRTGKSGSDPYQALPVPVMHQEEAKLMECATFAANPNIHFLAQLTTAGAVGLRNTVDEGELAVRDYTMLGFGMDTASREWRKKYLWDGAAKKVLMEKRSGLEQAEMRVCMRCGNGMEEPKKAPGQQTNNFLLIVSSRCACGGMWVSALPNESF